MEVVGVPVSRAFVDHSRALLTASYLPRIERALAKLPDRDLWWRPGADSNSVGNLMLHLSGNVRQWIVSGIGGAADDRIRQSEFDERGSLPRHELWSRLQATVHEADLVLAALDPEILPERRLIQGFETTVFEAIYHVVEHFSMHTGQIFLLVKMRTGDLGFYATVDGLLRRQWHERREEP
jgi:uncharacterized damage-inducible protein DinB